jgi:hypothetical protein
VLIYHPAYDLNHGMFRMLRLLEVNPEHRLKWDVFRILDFYYLFPHLLDDARLPRNMMGRKRLFAKLGSKYTRVPTPKMFIQQLLASHESIARSLIGKGFLDARSFEEKLLSRTQKPIPSELQVAFDAALDDRAIIEMLATELAGIPLSGSGGLKERTGLLEHRYDAA